MQHSHLHLISIGDHIEGGEYTVHSRFSKALNFVRKNHKPPEVPVIPMLSFVTKDVGAGPTNIVIQSLQPIRESTCCISHNRLMLGQYKVSFDASIQYTSSYHAPAINSEEFAARLHLFEDALVRRSPPKSLVVLLDPEQERHFRSGFERAILERLRDNVQELLHGNVEKGVRLIKGVGFGLTPSGDDLLTGVLLGLWFMQHISNYDFMPLRKKIYASALGRNPLSNTFLQCAKKGWLSERWKHAVKFLSGVSAKSHDWIIGELLSIGATSGADTAVGSVLAMKYAGNMRRET